MAKQKRFIAGAVCPKCGEMDRLVSYADEQGSHKECVACGFQEKQLAQVELSELDTRVNQVSEDKPSAQDASVQVVQLMDIPKK